MEDRICELKGSSEDINQFVSQRRQWQPTPGRNTGVGQPFPPPGDLPDPGIEPESPVALALTGGFSTTEPPGEPTGAEEERLEDRKDTQSERGYLSGGVSLSEEEVKGKMGQVRWGQLSRGLRRHSEISVLI